MHTRPRFNIQDSSSPVPRINPENQKLHPHPHPHPHPTTHSTTCVSSSALGRLVFFVLRCFASYQRLPFTTRSIHHAPHLSPHFHFHAHSLAPTRTTPPHFLLPSRARGLMIACMLALYRAARASFERFLSELRTQNSERTRMSIERVLSYLA